MSCRRRRCPSDPRVAAWAAIVAVWIAAFLPATSPAAQGVLSAELPGELKAVSVSGGNVDLETDAGRTYRLQHKDGRLVLRPGGTAEAVDVTDRLPDAVVVRDPSGLRAWLGGATERYRHGILSDRIEASRLYAALPGERRREISIELGPDSVFEDLQPRFVDAGGDGGPGILVVKSYVSAGAAAALYRVQDDRILPVAETDPIGAPNRWLKPVGVADFDGDGRPELAVVLTPHIGGMLTFYRLEDGRFRRLLSVPGVSNHAIGSRTLQQAAIADFDGDGTADIAVPSQDRRRLLLVSFAGAHFREIGRIEAAAPITGAVAAADIDGNGRPDAIFGVAGRLFVVLR
jgi:hypothetical protein